MSRRSSRQAVVQNLYRDEFHQSVNKKEDNDFFYKNLNQRDRCFALDILKNIQAHKSSIDQIIKKYSQNWKLERISLVDLNIMRLAVFEILFCADIPDKAALNEALELAKELGGENSVPFINGILNQVLKSKQEI